MAHSNARTTLESKIASLPSRARRVAGLYRPVRGKLQRLRGDDSVSIEAVECDIKNLVSQKNYPCVAALRSYHRDEYQVGLYEELGQARNWRELRNDLLGFLEEQRKSSSIFLSFWAIFDEREMSEEEFEQRMWFELSFLTSEEDSAADWPPTTVKDPADPAFRFSLGGSEFFVVGMHRQSSRLGRRFTRPALVFNVFDQFSQLQKMGQYDAMVTANRDRDVKFQGHVNPMVALHGEKWESIQFSGRANPSNWKCPFQFLSKTLKR